VLQKQEMNAELETRAQQAELESGIGIRRYHQGYHNKNCREKRLFHFFIGVFRKPHHSQDTKISNMFLLSFNLEVKEKNRN
jgi:hypothetical protein